MIASNDFVFVDHLVGEAEDKKAAKGLAALCATEKHAIAIWAASGIIGNGGFQYFFENGLSAEAAAEGYDAIGMAETADIFRTALSLFPNGKPQTDWEEALAFIRSKENLFNTLSSVVWNSEVEMVSRLARYLRESASPISRLTNTTTNDSIATSTPHQ